MSPRSNAYPSRYPYLSGARSLYEKAHNGVVRDAAYHGKKPIRIGGKTYERGLLLCPAGKEGRGIFVIGLASLPDVKGLTAEVGIEDRMTATGSSAFIVEAFVGDGWRQLFKSKVLTVDDAPVKVDVRIPVGSEFVRLLTTDGGNGGAADHAMWAEARFTE